jgi:hypothetical protein
MKRDLMKRDMWSSSTSKSHKVALEQYLLNLKINIKFMRILIIILGTAPPVNAYDKNGLKALIMVAKDRPRDDVVVMVVSVLSTNTSPVKAFIFQAAVPKVC